MLYAPSWIRSFLISTQGGEKHSAFLKMSIKARAGIKFPERGRDIALLYPSSSNVQRNSGAGQPSSGLRCDSRLWDAPGFPRHLVRNPRSKFGDVDLGSNVRYSAA